MVNRTTKVGVSKLTLVSYGIFHLGTLGQQKKITKV